MKSIKIEGEYIKLDQALKLGEFVQSGGEAKIIIKEGLVRVNGIVAYQRGKKLKKGDQIEFQDQKIVIE